ncbi:PepSY domain-containing protein [Sphingomonas sp.]|uniref:PepSY-associated TM helix domain-containing protein n=1 Tax=Sphingomonas sp. TaxID=28214 RepID=UPI003D6CDCFA
MTAMTETAPRKRQPIWPKVPADFVRAVLKGHSALGLAFAAAIYLVCLSGSIAVFAREFQRWEHPAAPRIEAAAPVAVQTAFTGAMARAGNQVEHAYVTLPSPELPWLLITTEGKAGEHAWVADGQGRIAGSGTSPWTEFVTHLHINLHLPQTWGMFLVGLTGVALLSSLISGLLAHPRVFRDAFHVRLGGSRRLQEADLHNRLGVWALPFHVIVSLTGALLGLTTLIVGVLGLAVFQGDVNKVYALFLPPLPKDDPRPAPLPDLAAMLRQASVRSPGATPAYILMQHPAEYGQATQVGLRQPNRLAGTDALTFDRDGKLFHASYARDNNLGKDILGSIGSLHFGWFGGGAVRVVYGLLGLGLTYLAASGVTIWLARRRDKGRPAQGWERVWTSVVWGQPLAFAVAALGVVIAGTGAPLSLPLSLWGGATLLALAASGFVAAKTLSRACRAIGGAALVLAALGHVALRGGLTGDPVAVIVNAVLLLLGVGLVASVLRRGVEASVPA